MCIRDRLGAYFCGHPLDSMRGVIDAEKYTRIGLIDTLEPHELKQKTAYEISRSDWSSDVCSSDLYRSNFRNVRSVLFAARW